MIALADGCQTMARLKKLAMHEKDESNRARAMSMGTPAMSMGTPAMAAPSTTTSTMSTPAMASMPNPRPQSQASARIQPMSQGARPIPANMAMHSAFRVDIGYDTDAFQT